MQPTACHYFDFDMASLVEGAGHGSLRIGDTVLFLIKTKDYRGYVYSELSGYVIMDGVTHSCM